MCNAVNDMTKKRVICYKICVTNNSLQDGNWKIAISEVRLYRKILHIHLQIKRESLAVLNGLSLPLSSAQ